MKKTARILIYTLVSLLVLFLLLVAFTWMSRDKIKQYAITQINTQLTAPVSVRTIDITFIDQFPRISLLFNDVVIPDPIRKGDTLLQTHRLFIAFNLYDILTDDYKIKRIEADSGQLNLFVDKKGNPNYLIVKPSGDNQNNLLLSLQHIQLKGIKLSYEDQYTKQLIRTDLQDMTFAGSFKTGNNEVSAEGKMFVHLYQSGKVRMVRNKQVETDMVLFFDETRSTYVFKKGDLHVGSLAMSCTGTITNMPQYTLLDIGFNAQKLSITDLLELLPGSVSQSVQAYKSSGNIYFKGSIRGKSSAKLQPNIELSFGIENGSLDAGNKLKLSQINCKGSFTNGSKQSLSSSSLTLSSFAFTLGDGHFAGNLKVTDFNNPNLEIAVNGQTSLQNIIDFSGDNWIKKANGLLEVDLTIKGNLAQLKKTSGLLNSETSGRMYCKATDIEWTDPAANLKQFETKLTLSGANAYIEQLQAQMGTSDLTLSGQLNNILPWILDNKQVLEADLNLSSTSFNPENIKIPVGSSEQTPEQQNQPFALPANLILNTRLSIYAFNYKTFNASQVKGNITWKGKKINVEDLSCNAFNGTLKLTGQAENTADGRFVVNTKLDGSKLDIQELFKQCNNFDQSEITNQHLKGQLTTQLELLGVWSPKLECETDKLYVLANVHITNGELNQYKPMESLSKFVSIDDLRNLKFADLKNTIEIKNRTIRIPSMEVQNNALNMSVAGTHTFDNVVDYHFKIRLGDWLAKKYKLRSNEYEEDVQNGGMYVYIHMSGNASDPKFTYDKKQAREKVKADLQAEKEAVKKVWRKELGLDDEQKIPEKKTDSDELEFEEE